MKVCPKHRRRTDEEARTPTTKPKTHEAGRPFHRERIFGELAAN